MKSSILAVLVVSILVPPAHGQQARVRVQYRPNPNPFIGQVVYLHRPDGAPILAATDYGAMVDLMQFALANDADGMRDLVGRGRVVKLPEDTAVKAIVRDTVRVDVPITKVRGGRPERIDNELAEITSYQVRVLAGPHAGKVVFAMQATTFDRREVAAKKKSRRR